MIPVSLTLAGLGEQHDAAGVATPSLPRASYSALALTICASTPSSEASPSFSIVHSQFSITNGVYHG